MKSKRSKATDITPNVKNKVWERDFKRCVVCYSPNAFPNAHVFIRRSHGGLGIEENIVTLCNQCHRDFDEGKNARHEVVKEIIYEHMYKHYPDLDITKLKY